MNTAEALRITKDPDPFSMDWVAVDASRRYKGGRHMHMAKAVRCGAAHNLAQHDQIAIQDAGGTGHPIPVHMDLITKVNGERVE